MNIVFQGVDFRNCPAAAREKLVLNFRQQEDFLRHCRNFPQISDAMILNTCNRLEFYFYSKKHFDVSPVVDNFISHNCWNEHKQVLKDLDVAGHLFKVAGGLESQIIGENEIFSQLKSAYIFALKCDSVDYMFHHLLHGAFRAAKAVRTHTNINTGALSIAQAAVQLAADNIAIDKAKVFVIGSGKNAELVVKHLIRKKVQDITIVARNPETAGQLIVKTTGKFLPLTNLENNLSDADVIFAATAAQESLITAAQLEKRTKPLILIDLSVPPNVDYRAKKLDTVKLFNIDSLNKIISGNNLKRLAEVPKVQAIIDKHVQVFSKWFQNSETKPAVMEEAG
ncbi:MAG: glutamyl-tRNA reductase [Sedimentisphaerales bacterium]|jgi:glutamyl-tRNA reductase